ncbi:hypothetical protein TD95_002931 [Thielaviopsis punctulata]|uniref:Histone-lysine N-methyltransferase, H3 lysine-36 specific n=1 Tax=Thielaviopsis punctulata TaxID=72032 RepID=A0A0F4Z8G2_9PEZI|nr:hypothetical protein TD95_002931 [Thielaviopsis punctulata]
MDKDKPQTQPQTRNTPAGPLGNSLTPSRNPVSTPTDSCAAVNANGNGSGSGKSSSNGATNGAAESVSETLSSKPSRKSSAKIPRREPVLFKHLPDATEEATKTFEVIPDCIYASKNMGNTDSDALDCDCRPKWDNEVNLACGEDGDCINRATKCECVVDVSTCGDNCKNQRFQRKQYANVAVIKTEKKGYGLRANTDLQAHDFIFEYIGDVINTATFRKRMIKYDSQGIKHFYFMSLTRTEFVDATVKGNLGRFCNHSCNPNCYVDKWVVGDKLRMGIFALREIVAGEELVFNYNVDRYGADPQVCYCGEPNCVGFIGGKTQTERATKLPSAVAEALGIEDSDSWDTTVAKKPRKKKTDEEDETYVDGLEAKILDDDSVRKVMAVLMQCKERWIATKLLERIKNCNDERILGIVVRMHAYQIMKSVLNTFAGDDVIVLQVLRVLIKFPRITNNKIQASKIPQTIQGLVDNANEEVATAARDLLSEWAKLKSGYRITKRQPDTPYEQDSVYFDFVKRQSNSPTANASEKKEPSPIIDAPKGPKNNIPQRNPLMMQQQQRARRMFNQLGTGFGGQAHHNMHQHGQPLAQQQQQEQQPQQQNIQANNQQAGLPLPQDYNSPLPEGWNMATDQHNNVYYYNAAGVSTWDRPTAPRSQPVAIEPPKLTSHEEKLQNLIKEVLKGSPKPTTAAPQPTPKEPEQLPVQRPSSKDTWWKSLPLEKQKKHYENTISAHVLSAADPFYGKLSRSEVKTYSREICKKLVESDYKHGRVQDPRTPLSSKSAVALKRHVTQFFEKAVAKSAARHRSTVSSTSSHRKEPQYQHSDAAVAMSTDASVPRQTSAAPSLAASTNGSGSAVVPPLEDTPMSSHSSPASDSRNKRKRDGAGDLVTDVVGDVIMGESQEAAMAKRIKDEPTEQS